MEDKSSKTQAQNKTSSIPLLILKVVYAPRKAFREMKEKPKVIGPIIIMILFIVAGIGSDYSRASKVYFQQTLPSSIDPYNFDLWAENLTLWESNANTTNYDQDVLYGVKNIQFSVDNDTAITMTLKNIGQVDCASSNGYKNLTFGIKWIHPTAKPPQNISLYLFNTNMTDYFRHDLFDFIDQGVNNQWYNLTISVGPSAERWSNSSIDTTWNSIEGLRLEVLWNEQDRANMTVRIDGLFFESDIFKQLIDSPNYNTASSVFASVVGFAFNWMLFTIASFFAARIFKIKAEIKLFLIIVGYSLIAFVFMQVLAGIFYYLIPPLRITLHSVTPEQVLQNVIAFNFYTNLLLPIWSIALIAFAVREMFDQPTRNSITVAIIGLLPHYLMWILT